MIQQRYYFSDAYFKLSVDSQTYPILAFTCLKSLHIMNDLLLDSQSISGVVCIHKPGYDVESAVHTSFPALCTSAPPSALCLQLAVAPDTAASWESPYCWWEPLLEAASDPGLTGPPEPSRSVAPSSARPLSRTQQSGGCQIWCDNSANEKINYWRCVF